ncbi:MAG: hypothetical protein LBE36_06710 [Flavobacteriaceae bacterium]|jgi:hypothetical protein|nr:hypothetical protein [Flavobacteriaceae bacterium]
MKKILLLAALFITSFLLSQTTYQNGFSAGFKAGYCYGEITGCIAPVSPIAPLDINQTYQSGYNNGFVAGQQRKTQDTQNTGGAYGQLKPTEPYQPQYYESNPYSGITQKQLDEMQKELDYKVSVIRERIESKIEKGKQILNDWENIYKEHRGYINPLLEQNSNNDDIVKLNIEILKSKLAKIEHQYNQEKDKKNMSENGHFYSYIQDELNKYVERQNEVFKVNGDIFNLTLLAGFRMKYFNDVSKLSDEQILDKIIYGTESTKEEWIEFCTKEPYSSIFNNNTHKCLAAYEADLTTSVENKYIYAENNMTGLSAERQVDIKANQLMQLYSQLTDDEIRLIGNESLKPINEIMKKGGDTTFEVLSIIAKSEEVKKEKCENKINEHEKLACKEAYLTVFLNYIKMKFQYH